MGVRFPDGKRLQQLRAALPAVVERVRRLDGVEKIIVFGSVARGTARSSADLDLIVIMHTQERFLDRLDRVYEAAQPDVACDILVYTPEEMATLPATSGFLRHALREG